MTNARRPTKGLNTDQVKELTQAWYHSARTGRSLNTMLSIRPIKIDELSPLQRCRLFARLRNKLSVYARLRAFEPRFIWSREVNPDGGGEHIHVLMHVPAKYRVDFEETALRWYPGPAECEIGRADHRVRYSSNGKRLSAVGYLCKQMTPQAWYRRGLIRKPGGPLLGKRGGTTKNLDRRAREAFRASWPAFSGTLTKPAIFRHQNPGESNSAADNAPTRDDRALRTRAGAI